jgi:hypothetical protein
MCVCVDDVYVKKEKRVIFVLLVAGYFQVEKEKTDHDTDTYKTVAVSSNATSLSE